MRYRARFLALLLGVVAPVWFEAPVAVAQADAVTETARQRFQEGVKFYDQRQYDKARLAFLQAYALKPHPAILLNLAQSELRSNYPADAAGHLAQYLRENTEVSESEKQEAELGFAAAKAKVGEAILSVDSEGAEIFVDGASKGRSPLADPLYVTPGEHAFEARKGGQSVSSTVSIGAGKSMTVELNLKGGGAPPAPLTAGGAASAAPAEPESTEDRPTPPEEEPATEAEAEASTSGGRMPFLKWLASNKVAWVGIGLTGLGLVGGTVFALTSSSEYGTANSLKDSILAAKARDVSDGSLQPDTVPCRLTAGEKAGIGAARAGQYENACSKYQDHASTGDTHKTLSIVGFVVAGVAAAGTVVYYFVDPKAKTSGSSDGSADTRFQVAVVPVVGASEAGLSLAGTF